MAQTPVALAGTLVSRTDSWQPEDDGTVFAVTGSVVKLTRTTSAAAVLRLAPTQSSNWTSYRVTSDVSALHHDLAHGGPALRVLTGSENPVECRVGSDGLQVILGGPDGQGQILADASVPSAPSHNVQVSVAGDSVAVKPRRQGVLPRAPRFRYRRVTTRGHRFGRSFQLRGGDESWLFSRLAVSPLVPT